MPQRPARHAAARAAGERAGAGGADRRADHGVRGRGPDRRRASGGGVEPAAQDAAGARDGHKCWAVSARRAARARCCRRPCCSAPPPYARARARALAFWFRDRLTSAVRGLSRACNRRLSQVWRHVLHGAGGCWLGASRPARRAELGPGGRGRRAWWSGVFSGGSPRKTVLGALLYAELGGVGLAESGPAPSQRI